MIEKDGRFRTDVFCLPRSDNANKILAQETFLNQKLLDKGMVVPLSDGKS